MPVKEWGIVYCDHKCFLFLCCVEHVLNKSYKFSEINILHRIDMFCVLILCLELRVKLLLQWIRGGQK